MTELAPAVEQMGFESLWVAEHSHIPTSRLSPWAGGAELPKHYWHTLDPFVALTVAALASKTIHIGTAICLLIERDPIHTAKEVASVDLVSNGRFIFGIGGVWNREEKAEHGADPSKPWNAHHEWSEGGSPITRSPVRKRSSAWTRPASIAASTTCLRMDATLRSRSWKSSPRWSVLT